jgi:hypothetical protein
MLNRYSKLKWEQVSDGSFRIDEEQRQGTSTPGLKLYDFSIAGGALVYW